MAKIIIDFETRCNLDITVVGRQRYIHDDSFDILLMAYKIDDEPTTLWEPGDVLPDFMSYIDEHQLYAHNAQFDADVWNTMGTQYGFPPVHISKWVDTMALCCRYGVPKSLSAAAVALNCTERKAAGKTLIKLFCVPPFQAQAGPCWEEFKHYCIQDVNTTYDVLHALPSPTLSADEQETWEFSCHLNAKGIPVDHKSISTILTVADEHRKAHFATLGDLTGGVITKITQTKRIVKFVNEHGVIMDNCQAGTIAEMMERLDEFPPVVQELISMRSELGLSSIGKYERFNNMTYNGRIYDNSVYYGTHTGRWTGTGVQLLNLPRASVKDPEDEIAKFFDGRIAEENPVKSARALLRPMIMAPEGKLIAAADYSSIEFVVAEWIVGNQRALQDFRDMRDQYIVEAANMFNIPYDEVNKEQRRLGKTAVLACGYGQGWRSLIKTAAAQGLEMSEEVAQFTVNSYRKYHAMVVDMWYKSFNIACEAVCMPDRSLSYNNVSFVCRNDKNGRKWLVMTLPSGRRMMYSEPAVVSKSTKGVELSFKGQNPLTKQWVRINITPGRLFENIVQATARDILVHGMRMIQQNVGDVIIWSIYDEVVCEIPADNPAETLKAIEHNMCQTQPWSHDIPLRAEGFYGKRYRKM